MSSSRRLSFYDLPENVRTDIFVYSGLERPCPIGLTGEAGRFGPRRRRPQSCWVARQPQCTFVVNHYMNQRLYNGGEIAAFACNGLPLPIALLSVSRSVYKEALPVLYGRNKFKVRASTAKDLEILRTIGPTAVAAMRSLHIFLDPGESKVLSTGTPSDDGLLEGWERTCEYLAETIPARQMFFAFSCVAADGETAERLAKSLRTLTTMADCAISFGSLANTDLRPIARDVCLDLTGKVGMLDTFPFYRLPKELQLLVLEQSEIVARSNGIQWDGAELPICNGRLVTRRVCCTRCTDDLEGCCCLTRPNTFSVTCRCFLGPTMVFTASKQLHECATTTLFSRNKFRFGGDLSKTLDHLHKLPSTSVRLMRAIVLELDMENHLTRWRSDPDAFRQQWRTMIDFVHQSCDLGMLSLTVDLSDWENDYWLDDEDGITSAEVMGYYRDVLKPVRQLTGLARYFVLLKEFQELEERAEKEVMGEEYDSAKVGKPSLSARWGHSLYIRPEDHMRMS